MPRTPGTLSSYSEIRAVPSQSSVLPFCGLVSTREMFRAMWKGWLRWSLGLNRQRVPCIVQV